MQEWITNRDPSQSENRLDGQDGLDDHRLTCADQVALRVEAGPDLPMTRR
jgi:hypothetical protein